MQTEPHEFRAMTAGKIEKGFSRISQHIASTYRHAEMCSPEMVDQAFAVYSRIDTGVARRKPIFDGAAKHGPKSLQSAARELVASISAQLESVDCQRRELERLLDGAEATAS
jgi:hypothetical protein